MATRNSSNLARNTGGSDVERPANLNRSRRTSAQGVRIPGSSFTSSSRASNSTRNRSSIDRNGLPSGGNQPGGELLPDLEIPRRRSRGSDNSGGSRNGSDNSGGSRNGSDNSGGSSNRRTRRGGISVPFPDRIRPTMPAPEPKPGQGSKSPENEEETERYRRVRRDSRDRTERPLGIRQSGLNRGSDAMRESNMDEATEEALQEFLQGDPGNQYGEMAESGFYNFAGGGASGGAGSSGDGNQEDQNRIVSAGLNLQENSIFGISIIIAVILIFIGVNES